MAYGDNLVLDCTQCDYHASSEIRGLIAERDRYREALERIAFDPDTSPRARARAVLGAKG